MFDVIHLLIDNGTWAEIAYWMIAAGLIGGVLIALIATIDWLAIRDRTRAKANVRAGIGGHGAHARDRLVGQ